MTAILALLSGCGRSSSSRVARPSHPSSPTASWPASRSPQQSAAPTESPVAAESNPPGDIPDTTQFIPYRSARGHFLVKVPEGWSRTTRASAVTFTDKLNSVEVLWSAASSAPTVSTVTSSQIPELRSTQRAFTLGRILSCAPSCTIPYSTGPISVSLHGLDAVVVTYRVNSEPNSVTGKQYRLEIVRFDFYRNGEQAELVLSGPVGSDNVDPWRLVSQSFRWM